MTLKTADNRPPLNVDFTVLSCTWATFSQQTELRCKCSGTRLIIALRSCLWPHYFSWTSHSYQTLSTVTVAGCALGIFTTPTPGRITTELSGPASRTHRLISWRRRIGRPRQTWLKTVDADLRPTNLGLATVKRRAEDRSAWRKLMATATSSQAICWTERKRDGTDIWRKAISWLSSQFYIKKFGHHNYWLASVEDISRRRCRVMLVSALYYSLNECVTVWSWAIDKDRIPERPSPRKQTNSINEGEIK